jgi:hypothetical protein
VSSNESGSGALRRARLWLPAVVGTATVLALAVPGRPVYGSAIRGYGSSWQPVAGIVSTNHRRARHHRPHGHGKPSGAFRIGGSVGGLYPGLAARLVLTVVNPQRYAIVVKSITTGVGTPKAGCGASNLTVGAFSGRLPVSARSSAEVSVRVTLVHSAPDACQGAVFPLQYSGLARR